MDGSFKDYLEIWNLSFIFPCFSLFILYNYIQKPKTFKMYLFIGSLLFVIGMNLSLYLKGPVINIIDYLSVISVLSGGLITLVGGILYLREKHHAKNT